PDTALARRVAAMRRDGAPASDPAAFCRLASRLDAADAVADMAAWSRRRSDPCAHPNEWPDSLGAVVMATFAKLGAYDWRPAIAARRVPTLVVQGTHDFVPQAAGDEWAAAPNARLLRVRAGHWPHVERPDEVLGAIANFLDAR
ncbi:alpha/beta hydrolase, partial [Roseisolibacter sp. H3M3-2]|uniref:alpha/beta fold hydrolase n=1 Tax=Roseisolibacter sp. H3M3-2 TaxID=3031323 RepID=UPI0023DBC46E